MGRAPIRSHHESPRAGSLGRVASPLPRFRSKRGASEGHIVEPSPPGVDSQDILAPLPWSQDSVDRRLEPRLNSLLVVFLRARRAQTNPSVRPAEDTLRRVAHSRTRTLPRLTTGPAGDDVDGGCHDLLLEGGDRRSRSPRMHRPRRIGGVRVDGEALPDSSQPHETSRLDRPISSLV